MPMCKKRKKVPKELRHTKKEEIEYIQGQIDKIIYSVDDRQLWLARQLINEVSG